MKKNYGINETITSSLIFTIYTHGYVYKQLFVLLHLSLLAAVVVIVLHVFMRTYVSTIYADTASSFNFA